MTRVCVCVCVCVSRRQSTRRSVRWCDPVLTGTMCVYSRTGRQAVARHSLWRAQTTNLVRISMQDAHKHTHTHASKELTLNSDAMGNRLPCGQSRMSRTHAGINVRALQELFSIGSEEGIDLNWKVQV